MDYNNGNNMNNNMNMGNPRMGNGPMGNPGMGYPPNQGRPPMGNPPMGNPGMGYPPNQGRPPMGNPQMGNGPMGNPGMGYPPNQGRPPMGYPQGMQQGRPQGMFQGRQPAGVPGMKVTPAATDADVTSNRLAREIEKSVNGDMPKGRPREGRKGLGPISISLPEGLTAGISTFSTYIYAGILVLCLIISLVAYGKNHKGGGGGRTLSAPPDMMTYSGIFKNAYEAAASGSISDPKEGVLYNDDGTEVPAAPTAIGEEVPSATDSAEDALDSSGDSSDTGASDTSSSSGSYGQAESYKELLTQLESAIASGDTAFVASKMAYEDESGTLKAYPQTVVDHFVSYMSSNTDKLSSLMVDLSNDKYSGQNNGDFIVKLPYIKFVVNMGYDNTTVSLPGFSDQVVNAGQSADIAPLLPCMYTLTISNPDWNDVVTRDIEANINESTISINIKP